MNGVLIVDKRQGWTSHDVVENIKKQCKCGKVGHAGTLDPNATGVLVVCLGNATRFIRFLSTDPKVYVGEMILGVTTDTLDSTGTVLTEQRSRVSLQQLQDVSHQFLGTIEQIPPMVSAVKQHGKPLYLLARQGKTIDRKPRPVQILSLQITDLFDDYHQKAIFEVTCSKGTYVRSLCEDIGTKLGCGACLGDLRRLRSGVFRIENALDIEDVLKTGVESLRRRIISLGDALVEYQMVEVKAEFGPRFINGGYLVSEMVNPRGQTLRQGQELRVVEEKGDFLGIAQALKDGRLPDSFPPDQPLLRPLCVIPYKQG